MQALAAQVAALSPGADVRGCTLASKGALSAALQGAEDALVYPFFMADGWFVREELPRRLRAVSARNFRVLPPFGADPGLLEMVETAAGGARRLLLAGHGSQRSSSSADTLEALAASLRDRAPDAVIATGYVEQAPFLEDVAREMGDGLCLPFFALEAGHVLGDIPEALAAAGFKGDTLPPIGRDARTPGLIARSIERAIKPSAHAL